MNFAKRSYLIFSVFFIFGMTSRPALAFQNSLDGQGENPSLELASPESSLQQLAQQKNGLKALQKQLLLANGVRFGAPILGVFAVVNGFVQEMKRQADQKGLHGILKEMKVDPKNKRLESLVPGFEKSISAAKKERNVSLVAAASAGVIYWKVESSWIPYLQVLVDQKIKAIEELEHELADH